MNLLNHSPSNSLSQEERGFPLSLDGRGYGEGDFA